jgi:hypothetical protein
MEWFSVFDRQARNLRTKTISQDRDDYSTPANRIASTGADLLS